MVRTGGGPKGPPSRVSYYEHFPTSCFLLTSTTLFTHLFALIRLGLLPHSAFDFFYH
jgi:hypothetical protein